LSRIKHIGTETMGMKNIRNRSTTSRYDNPENIKTFTYACDGQWTMFLNFITTRHRPCLPPQSTDVNPPRTLPCHPHAQMHMIYIYIYKKREKERERERENRRTRAVYIIYFLSLAFVAETYAHWELMWICAFLWFGFHAQRYLFTLCTWRAFLLSTRLLTATNIIVEVLFSPARPKIPHAILHYMRPYISDIRLVKKVLWPPFKYVCMLMKSNKTVGSYIISIWERGEQDKFAIIQHIIYCTSTNHQRNPK